jgi:uncharacterized membrane protein YfcA
MITDPVFYVLAVAAVILIGLSKGGFGGALALLGVPMVALAIPPVQAAAIFLPILVVMDLAGLYAWRGIYDKRTLVIMLPGALIGIAVGWLTAAYVNDSHIRLIVGTLALAFVAQWWFSGRERRTATPHNRLKGRIWGMVAGFTSFVSHAGGPPFQMYSLPLKLDKTVYAGTGVIFFAVVNAVKLPPYFALGQFTAQNLLTSAILIPLAPLATLAGAWLVKRVDQTLFYRITYAALIPVGLKLVWDGLFG